MRLFSGSANSINENKTGPSIELGFPSNNEKKVVMSGQDRTLNTMVIGPIGTGKLAGLAIPVINQDLHHLVSHIKDYTEMNEGKDLPIKKGDGNYLSGISVISPSEGLCQRTLELARAHNIPEELITYIDPLNPNTPSINAMVGPVDKVAEVFTQVIEGLNDSKNEGSSYFLEAQRNHLKHYIYLLKLHDTEKEVTFDMLLEMYNNPQLVHQMHEQLKTTIPTSINEIENKDVRNQWEIVKGVEQWFDENNTPKLTKIGSAMIPEHNTEGDLLYIDAKAEHVQGLRAILNDIGGNLLIRRVLFGKSDFDFMRHIERGGILLVNTAKGELRHLSQVLGRIVLMNVQNAIFSRTPMESTFHHVLVDEVQDYLFPTFRELTAQTRKYKVIITAFIQTIESIANNYGENYMTTLFGTMRNRIFYGDIPRYDAKYFSEMFGENIYFQEPMHYTASLVVNNRPMPAVQLQASFVPPEEFSEAIIQLTKTEQNRWLKLN